MWYCSDNVDYLSEDHIRTLYNLTIMGGFWNCHENDDSITIKKKSGSLLLYDDILIDEFDFWLREIDGLIYTLSDRCKAERLLPPVIIEYDTFGREMRNYLIEGNDAEYKSREENYIKFHENIINILSLKERLKEELKRKFSMY